MSEVFEYAKYYLIQANELRLVDMFCTTIRTRMNNTREQSDYKEVDLFV